MGGLLSTNNQLYCSFVRYPRIDTSRFIKTDEAYGAWLVTSAQAVGQANRLSTSSRNTLQLQYRLNNLETPAILPSIKMESRLLSNQRESLKYNVSNNWN